jgi:tRNA nucleotidyltransferase (CCA-adding enzyme)
LEQAVEDVIWGQIFRNLDSIRTSLIQAGFRVMDLGAWVGDDEIFIAVQLESKDIGQWYLNEGPPFYEWKHVEDFLARNDYVWVGENGRLYSIKKRKNSDPIAVALNALKFKTRVEVLGHEWVTAPTSPELKRFLAKRPPWLK